MRLPTLSSFGKNLLMLGIAILFQWAFIQTANAATRTWDGGGADENWSTCANWSSDTCPTTADIATFDTTSTKNATIDASFTTGVTTFNMNSGYTGIITQARSFTVSGNTTMAAGTFTGSTDNLTFTGTFTLSGGTFNGGNQTVQHTGTFTISSGTYTASSGTTTFTGAYTHTAGGTFTHNSGSVTFNGAATTTNVMTTETFNNLTLNKNSAALMTVSSGDTLTVNGTLTLTNGGFTTGTVNPKSTISVGSSWDGGGGTLLIDGSNTVTSSLIGGGAALASTVTLNNANYTLNGSGTGTLTLSAFNLQAGIYDSTGYSSTFSGAFVQSGGTFTGGSGTITHTGAFTESAGTYTASSGTTSFAAGFTHTAGGTFSHNNGTVTFIGAAATVNVATSETFYDLTLNKTANVALTISSGDTLICTHTLTLTEGDFNTGTIEMQGTFSHATTYDGGSGVLSITGSDTKTINFSTGNLPGIDLSNANVTLNVASPQTIEGSYTQSAGTFNGDASTTLTTSGAFTLSGGTYNCTTGIQVFGADFTHTAGGTFNCTGGTVKATGTADVTWDVSSTETFNHFTIEMTTGVNFNIATGDTFVVNGDLSESDGVWGLNVASIDLKGNLSQGANWDGTLSTETGADMTGSIINVNGTGTQTITLNATINKSPCVALNMDNSNASIAISGSGSLTLKDFTLNAGTANFSSTSVFFYDDVVIAGGVFTSSSGTTEFNGGFTHTAGGTFNHNSGTATFSSGVAGEILDFAGTETFNNVIFSSSTVGISTTISSGDTLLALGNLTLTEGAFTGGTVEVRGNVTVASTYDSGTTALKFSGTSDQSFDLTGAAAKFDGDITIDKPVSGTVSLLSAFTADTAGQDFTLTAGTFNPSNFAVAIKGAFSQAAGTYGTSTATLDIDGAFTLSEGTFNAPTSTTMNVGGAWTHTAGGTFTHNSGTVIFDTTSGSTIDVATSETFYNVTKNGSGISKTITAGDTLIVTGTLTLTDGSFNTGTLEAQGSVSVASTWDGGSTALTFSGTADQNFTLTSATALFDGDVTVNKPVSGTVTLTTAFTANASNQDLTITAGTLSLNGSNITVSGTGSTFVVQSGGTLQLQGGETVTGTPTLNSGSTVKYVGTSGPYTLANWTYTSATVTIAGGASSVFNLPGTKTVTNLTLTTGIFSPNGNGLTVSGTFSNDSTLRLRGNETVSLTMDTNSGITEYVGDGDAATDTFTLTDFGSTDYYNLSIATTDAADIVQSALLSSKSIAGTLTISSGTLDANTTAISTAGTVTISGGTYSASTATQTMGGLTVSGGVLTGNIGTIDVNGNVSLSSGTLTAPSALGSFTIQGNFTKSGGTFTHNSGTATFDANANHSITGSVSWNSLTLQDTSNNATDVTLTIESGSTQTINGTLTLDGLDADDRLNIMASTTSASTFDFQGTAGFSGDYLDISYNTVTDNSSGLSTPINPANSVDSGNNTNWFPAATPGITVSAISGNTTEAGGTATFTIVLDTQPTNDVSVGLSSNDTTEGTVSPASVTFTSGNWSTPQTVTVTGVNDSLDDGDISYSIVTAAASSADGNYNNLNASDVSVTNTDNDTAGFTITESSGTTAVTEGGATDSFTVVLTAQPTSNVVFSVTSGDTSSATVDQASLTFTTLNWSTPQTITVTAPQDADVVSETPTITVSVTDGSSDDSWDPLADQTVNVTVTDNDTAGITVSAISGNTTEAGGTATFTIVLDTQPTNDVSVGISSNDTTEGTVSPASVTFTSGNWSTPQTVTVTGVDDSLDDGNISYSIVTAAASSADGNYNNLNASDVSVTNTDNDTAGFTITESSGTTAVTEGGATDSYTIVLTSEPTNNVVVNFSVDSQLTLSVSSLTFTSGNWNTPQTLTITAANDAVAEGSHDSSVSHTITSVDASYNNYNLSAVTVHITDNDTAGFNVSAISGTVSENGTTATYTVSLTSQPTADVTIGVSSNDTTEGTVSPASLTFTSGNWNTPQTVTVTGANDFVVDGTVSFSIVNAAASSADSNYNNLNPTDVSVSTTDNDSAGFSVSAISGTISENGTTATYTISLTSQPTADVTVGISSSNTNEGTVSPSSFTFTAANWNTPQTATVTGVDDLVADGTVSFSIVNAAASSADSNYNNLNPTDVSVNNTDNDSASITLTQSGGTTTVTEGGATDSYTIVLTTMPTADVTVNFTANSQLSTSVSSFTFTSLNWNTPQTLTVTAVNDAIAEGSHTGNISHSVSSSDTNYNGFSLSAVSASITDNDTAGITLTESSGSTNVTEGGTTDSYTLVLTSEPTSNVTITLTPNAQITLSAETVTFTNLNWSTPQTITVTAVNDSSVEGAHSGSVSHSVSSSDTNYNGFSLSSVTANITDNDTAGFTISTISGAISEAGTTATFTATLTSQPTDSVNFSIASNDTTEGTVSPSFLTFTTGNWSTPQTVTVTGVDDSIVDGTVSFSIVNAAATSTDGNYNGLNPDDVSVSTTDNDSAGITLTQSDGSTSVTEGGATDSYTLVLSTEPTNNVVITLTTDDQITLSASTLTFTTVNWATPQTVTVTAVDDTTVEAADTSSIASSVSSSDSNYNAFTISNVNVSITDNDTASGASGGSSGGSGGGGSFTIHSSSNTSSGSSQSSVQEIQSELGSSIPTHWADGYIKNALEENFMIEVAIAQNSFLDLLSTLFIQPNLNTNRSSALQFLMVQSGINISTITTNINRLAFKDITPTRDDFGVITFAAENGLVNGYPDGSFKPNRIINRAEALKLVFTFYKHDVQSDLHGEELLAFYELEENPFNDVDLDAWYAPYIIAAYHYGVVMGYPDGSFKPDREVSNGEFLKIAVLGKDPSQAVTLASELE